LEVLALETEKGYTDFDEMIMLKGGEKA